MSKNIIDQSYEELRDKLKNLESNNKKINEELFSLKNKFYVQTKILNDKSAELSKELSEKEKIQTEHRRVLESSEDLKYRLSNIYKENEKLQIETAKSKKDYNDLSLKYNDSNKKFKSLLSKLEEQNSVLAKENDSLKESSTKLQTRLNYIDNEMKAKESKITFELENKNKDYNFQLKKEIMQLQQKNDDLIGESLILKKEKNDILNELHKLMNESKDKDKDKDNTIVTSTNNTSVLVGNVGNYLEETKEELSKCKDKIKEYEKKEREQDKIIKSLRLDLNQSEQDAKTYYNQLQDKTEENKILNNDLIKLREEIKNTKNIETLNVELQEKNNTINFLLNQIENYKKDLKAQNDEIENTKRSLNEENSNMVKKLVEAQNSINDMSREYQTKISDLKKENDDLVSNLNNKDQEYSKLLQKKVKFENNCNIQFEEQDKKFNEIQQNLNNLVNENESLKNQLAQCTEIAGEKFKDINERCINSNQKLESLIGVYDKHLNFMKQRFDNILHELNILVNIQKNNPKDLNNKFNSLIQNIKNSIDLINKISEREALIEGFKKEVKSLKTNLANSNNKIKDLETENSELSKTLNIEKLRLKIKEPKTNIAENAYEKLTRSLKDYFTKTKNNVEYNNLLGENQSLQAQVTLFMESEKSLKETIANYENKVNELQGEMELNASNYSKETKDLKRQIKTIVEQLEKIKETWTPYEKKMEFINHISDLEKEIKQCNEDINRKTSYIAELKSQHEKKVNELNEIINQANIKLQKNGDDISKNLKAEIARKDGIIKELRAKCESTKESLKKLTEDKDYLSERSKINKIECTRKDQMIKDLKIKIQELKNQNIKLGEISENNELVNSQNNTNLQRIKNDNNRKDQIIKNLKEQIEILNNEINNMQNINDKKLESTNNNLQNQQKNLDQMRNEIEEYKDKIINLENCIKTIFKELINEYQLEKNKNNIFKISASIKEGMNILGMNENDADAFLNPGNENEYNEIYGHLENLLNNNNYSYQDIIILYQNIKLKIKQILYEKTNNMPVDNPNNNEQRNQNIYNDYNINNNENNLFI